MFQELTSAEPLAAVSARVRLDIAHALPKAIPGCCHACHICSSGVLFDPLLFLPPLLPPQAPNVVMDVGGSAASISGAVVDLSFLTTPHVSSPTAAAAGHIPFSQLPVAIGDLPVLQVLSASVVVGLDVLTRTRCVICIRDRIVMIKKVR